MAYQLTTPPAFLEPLGEKLGTALSTQIGQTYDISKISPQVAQVSPLIQSAQQRAATQAGLGALQFDPTTGEITGMGTGTGIAAYEPYLQQAQALTAPGAYQQYMSPYQQEVIDSTQRLLQEQRAAGRQSLADRAIQAGAFGGGREGVALAEYERGRDISDAATLAAIRQQGLQQAQALQQQGILNQLNLAQQQQALQGGVTAGLAGAGAGAQTYSQSILDALQQGNLLGYQFPMSQLQSGAGIYGAIASGTPQTPSQPMLTSPGLTAAQSFAGLFNALTPKSGLAALLGG